MQNMRIIEKNLQQLIERYEAISAEPAANTGLREAVLNFRREWNPQADDYAAMLRRALGPAEKLVHGGHFQPLDGMIRLAANPELTDSVKRMLNRLNFGGGYAGIVARVEAQRTVTAELNALLEEYEDAPWRYRQSRDLIQFIIFALDPEHNYCFRETPLRQIGWYAAGINPDRVSRQLSAYNSSCLSDALLGHLLERDVLRDRVRQRVAGGDGLSEDAELHILVFDFIWQATWQHLFEPDGAESAARQEELYALLKKRAAYDGCDMAGLSLEHERLGAGMLQEVRGRLALAAFPERKERFGLDKLRTGAVQVPEEPVVAKILCDVLALEEQIDECRCALRRDENNEVRPAS